MNLSNRITYFRIFLSILIIGILLFPFDSAGISIPQLFINESLVVDVKYIIVGVLFIFAWITDKIDGKIARKYNMATNYGRMLDNIADKILVDTILIILSTKGFIHVIIPILVICRDVVVDMVKINIGNAGEAKVVVKIGKFKNIFMMSGIILTLFYNLPFELWNIRIADILLIIATVLSIISAVEYCYINKKIILKN